MNKLNILMFGSSHGLGLLYYLTLYSIGLRQLGHTVTVISSHGEQSPGLLTDLEAHNIKYIESATVDKRAIIPIYTAAREIATILKSINIDVIHVNGLLQMIKAGLALRLAGRVGQIPIIFMVHSIRHGSKYEKWFCWLGSIFMNKYADLVAPVSEWERSRLIKGGLKADKAFTIHNAVDFNEFDRLLGEEVNYDQLGLNNNMFSDKTVVTLSQLIPRKGIHYLLNAVPKVLKVFPETKFLILGSGPLKDELINTSISLGLQENVHFPGNIDNMHIPKILSKASISVVPSLSETFGFAIIEPMAAGKPVISTAVGVAPEIIITGKNGYVVPPGNSDTLADAILFLLNNKEKAEEMGINARETVRNTFGLERISQNLEGAYRMAIKKLCNT
ncbi:MAG: glycosyltransferase family 1 protein [Nitrospiraceae bacterium]|nr:MAG: glycosyltransferase family 1 protein [Nitrospiraceae bacterium]